MLQASHFVCAQGCARYPLDAAVYACGTCGGLLEVEHDPEALRRLDAGAWRARFATRQAGTPGPNGSGVWRYAEWVLPMLPKAAIVTLGEGNTPLTFVARLSERLGVGLLLKQCGHGLSGSFKDLGMTVLVSQVAHARACGKKIRAIACASTGDTSAALAAYGAAANVPVRVLLPRGKISSAQLTQPLVHGAKVLSIAGDFDACMRHMQRLAEGEGVYLANSKNSLRLEGQKTVALEIAQGLGWEAPDWVVLPSGNLGNVAALAKGFEQAQAAGLLARVPRLLCAQSSQASPLYDAYVRGFAGLVPIVAQKTQASAIQIGNPVSFARAVAALRKHDGVVHAVDEQALCEAARLADACGLFVCPHTAVALACVRALIDAKRIARGARVVVVSTAHGLKFGEFQGALCANEVPRARLDGVRAPVEVADDFDAVRAALD